MQQLRVRCLLSGSCSYSAGVSLRFLQKTVKNFTLCKTKEQWKEAAGNLDFFFDKSVCCDQTAVIEVLNCHFNSIRTSEVSFLSSNKTNFGDLDSESLSTQAAGKMYKQDIEIKNHKRHKSHPSYPHHKQFLRLILLMKQSFQLIYNKDKLTICHKATQGRLRAI